MSNEIELPENLLSFSNINRCWNGVRVEVTEFNCSGRVVHQLGNQEAPRLSVLVEEVGNQRCEPRLRPDRICPVDYKPQSIYFAPGDMEIWGFSEDVLYVKTVDRVFDVPHLSDRLVITQMGSQIDVPRLRFTDNRIWTLANLLAEAVNDPDPSAQLYGDSLTAAVAAQLFSQTKCASEVSGRLSPRQLKDVLAYLDAHLPGRVDLATLAALADLSQSHFCRAFKASTGLAPYQWQLQARIERAKTMLLVSTGSLEDVAQATGFADAVHFGRTFRKLVGATPAAWRENRLT
jgi:AraC family transcriptional regulator